VALASAALFLGAGGSIKGIFTTTKKQDVNSKSAVDLNALLEQPASLETEAALEKTFERLYTSNPIKDNACAKILAGIAILRDSDDYGHIAMSKELSRDLSQRKVCTTEFRQSLALPEAVP
jgi:hypothetical protein